RVRAGGTRRDDSVVRTHKAVLDRDLPRHEIDETAMHEVRTDTSRAFFMEHDRFGFDARQTANARTYGAAGAEPLFFRKIGESGILDRLTGRIDAELDEQID